MRLLHRESLYQNTGLSFSERTYTLDPIQIGKLDSNKIYLPTYLDAGTYSMFGIIPTESTTGSIVVNVDYLSLPSSNDYGYYIQSITINPTYGEAFIQALASEPVIHYLCDQINEGKIGPFEERSVSIALPKFMEVYLPKNPSPITIRDTQYSVVESFNLEVELSISDVSYAFFNDEKNAESLYHYRNFDGYILNERDFRSGDEFLASDTSDIVERAFHIVDVKLREIDYDDDDDRHYVLDTTSFFYSGETYELKTPGAISLSHIINYPDIVEDLLGRHSIIPYSDRDVLSSSTEFDLIYRKYIETFGIGVERVSTSNIVRDLFEAQNEFGSNLSHDNEIKIQKSRLSNIRTGIYNTSARTGSSTYITKHYFCSIAERINICKELINLGFPTVDIDNNIRRYYVDALGRQYKRVNFPLMYCISSNRRYGFSSLMTGNLEDYKMFRRRIDVDMQTDTTKEMIELNRLLLLDRNSDAAEKCVATYSTSDFANIGGEPVKLMCTSTYNSRIKEKYIFPVGTVGDTLILTAIPLLSAELYVDTKQLKSIMVHMQRNCMDLSDITDSICFIDIGSFSADHKINLANLPTEWRGLQRPRNTRYSPAIDVFSPQRDTALFTYDLVEQIVTFSEAGSNSQVPGMTSFDAAKRIKSYNEDSDVAYVYSSFSYDLDPAHNIRTAINKEKERKGNNAVMSFGGNTKGIKEYSLDDYLPTNYYVPTIAPDFGEGFVYPLLGTYVKIATLISGECLPDEILMFAKKNTNKINALEELILGYKHKDAQESGWF